MISLVFHVMTQKEKKAEDVTPLWEILSSVLNKWNQHRLCWQVWWQIRVPVVHGLSLRRNETVFRVDFFAGSWSHKTTPIKGTLLSVLSLETDFFVPKPSLQCPRSVSSDFTCHEADELCVRTRIRSPLSQHKNVFQLMTHTEDHLSNPWMMEKSVLIGLIGRFCMTARRCCNYMFCLCPRDGWRGCMIRWLELSIKLQEASSLCLRLFDSNSFLSWWSYGLLLCCR